MNLRIVSATVGDRLSFARIMKLALGGAIGGLITFIVFNPFLRGKALFGNGDTTQSWVTVGTMLGAVVGLTIGACLIAAEEWHTRSAKRILRRSLTGALAGMACGALGGLDGQFTFAVVQPASVVLARCVGWALMGAGAGICPGLVSGSWKRAELGAFGGLIGGLVGGVLFDVLALITRSEDLSRALGFVLVGAAIGIAVGFLEEIAKEYWLTVLTGSREGQSYVLSEGESTIGRDETVDIPLYGDGSVQRAHARIVKSGAGACIRAEQPGSPVVVNSQPVANAPLSDGDIISIGKHRLRFGSRRATQAASVASSPQQVRPASATVLQVISGPHSGAAFPLSSASMPMGRSPECSIPLSNDSLVSRQHARIVWDGACWRVEDCGSTNGVYVNGQRVSAQAIHPGDEISVGQSTLRAL
jgi:pSer/pThr/pTyr-binding forkhead associated (FHA) protein